MAEFEFERRDFVYPSFLHLQGVELESGNFKCCYGLMM